MHEFAHGIQNLCFTPEDHKLWNELYVEAVQANLYPGSHMMHNVMEFFAVFSGAYFEVTDELGDDPDRKDLRDRFPDIVQALDEIYGGAILPDKFKVWLPPPR